MTVKKKDQVGYIAPPKVVDVTPDMATKWLEGNTHNRKLRQSHVDKYARDMKAGRWMATHQGIAFDEDGKLIDGQHRLWAVIESGCTVPMMVFNGLPRGTQLVVDDHLKRNILDSVALVMGDDTLTHRLAGVMRRVVKGMGMWPRWTKPEVMEEWKHYRAPILAVWGLFPGPKMRVTHAAVLAPMVRAWLTPAYRQEVEAFADVLYTGQYRLKRHAAVVIVRDQLLSGVLQNEEAYRKIETVLDACIRDRALQIVRPATKELFPLPDERDVTKVGRSRRPKNIAMDIVFKALERHDELSIKQIHGTAGKKVTYNSIRAAVKRLEAEGFIKSLGAKRVAGQKNKVKVYGRTSKAA
jgi:hypothetical protein